MKTAQELADELYVAATWRDDAHQTMAKSAAMIIQQAEQIEALTKMLVISDDTHQTWMKANAPRGWIDDLRIERDALKQQAQIHAMEAKTANSTIYEIYQVVSGGTGEPGNWNGARPVREAFDALKADAQRYRWYVAQLASGNLDKLDEAFRGMERVEVVTKQMFDAAIDAMKGAT